MADTKISALSAAVAATGGVLAGVQAGATVKFSATAAGAAMLEAANAAAQRVLLGIGAVGLQIAAFTTIGAGSLLYASAADTISELPAGTNGYVLRMVSGLPAWTAPAMSGSGVANQVTYWSSASALTSDAGMVYDATNDQLAIAAGTASLPSYAIIGDLNTGAYGVGADQFGITTGGTLRFTIGTTSVTSTLLGIYPLAASGAGGYASIRLPHGAAPTTNITDGDCWTTTSGFFVRVNAATQQMATNDGSGSVGRIGFWSSSNALGGDSRFAIGTATMNLALTQATAGSGANTFLTFTAAASTAQTASTEVLDANFNFSRILTHATGAITTQRTFIIQATTHAFAASSTITNAATFAITNAPIAGANATITNAYALWVQAGLSRLDGSLTLSTVGNGLLIKEGTNATMGVATLVAGTVTVSTTKVTASSRIFLTRQTNAGTVTGAVDVTARTGGTSFTITSANALDTSTVGWVILEPAA